MVKTSKQIYLCDFKDQKYVLNNLFHHVVKENIGSSSLLAVLVN